MKCEIRCDSCDKYTESSKGQAFKDRGEVVLWICYKCQPQK